MCVQEYMHKVATEVSRLIFLTAIVISPHTLSQNAVLLEYLQILKIFTGVNKKNSNACILFCFCIECVLKFKTFGIIYKVS